jgi:hypothetical protein
MKIGFLVRLLWAIALFYSIGNKPLLAEAIDLKIPVTPNLFRAFFPFRAEKAKHLVGF